MAIENFEGKNIQNTFQRVVQTDGTNRLADGTGSIFIPVSSSHAITASHALFAVSASHEITFELSSSHAVSADTASFATNFTASGNISASGNLFGSRLSIDGFVSIQTSSSLGRLFEDGSLTAIDIGRSNAPNKNISLYGPVTASGNISASGELSVTDNAFIGGKLSVNTTSTTARVNVVGSEVHQLNGTANTFKITGVSQANALFVSSSTKVGIGTQTPGEQLEVVGNISASGTISASRFNGSGGDLVDVSYNNLSFVPSGIISGAAQINNLDLTINGGTF